MQLDQDFTFDIAFLKAARVELTKEYNKAETQNNKSAMRAAFNAHCIAEALNDLVRAATPASRMQPVPPEEKITIDGETLASVAAETIKDPTYASQALMKLALFSNHYAMR